MERKAYTFAHILVNKARQTCQNNVLSEENEEEEASVFESAFE